ncbi:HNH endonuclease [Corallococcus terminator]
MLLSGMRLSLGRITLLRGVPFDVDGYPYFRAAGVVEVEVQIAYTGSRTGGVAAATRAAGLQATPKGMTWHHHQARPTMRLVPTGVHARTGHTGGFSGGQ